VNVYLHKVAPERTTTVISNGDKHFYTIEDVIKYLHRIPLNENTRKLFLVV